MMAKLPTLFSRRDSTFGTPYRRAHEAMATTFELFLSGASERYLGQAARACWERLEEIESALSRFREGSSISRLNRARKGEELRLHPDAYECLLLAEEARLASSGAFDSAVGTRGSESAGALFFYYGETVVRVEREGLAYDLGGIGKGYALDCLAQVLREWDVNRALLHGGGSSVLALDPPVDSGEGWEVGLPGNTAHAMLRLRNLAISASGNAVRGDHIFDPETGEAARRSGCIWCVAESAAWSDAMSTAAHVHDAATNSGRAVGGSVVIHHHGESGWKLYLPANVPWTDRMRFHPGASPVRL